MNSVKRIIYCAYPTCADGIPIPFAAYIEANDLLPSPPITPSHLSLKS